MPPGDTLKGATKKDIAQAVSIGFLILFGAIIIVLLLKSGYTVNISGNLDANLIWGTFIGIIMSVMTFLGFKSGQNANGSTPGPNQPGE